MTSQPEFYNTDYSRLHRWMVASSHYVTWFLGRNFPAAFPLVFVTGFPKSGTVWVTRMIADYLQLPYPHYSVFPIGCHAVVHGHQRVPGTHLRGAYVMRDGRDAMVSLYFHMARSLPEGDNPRMSRKQKQLFPGLVNKRNVRENLPQFLERQLARPFASQGMHWGQHVKTYLSGNFSKFASVKYEDLLADPHQHLAATVEKICGEDADPQQVRATVWKYSFEQQAGRKRGREDRSGFLRKGTSGDWRHHFSRAAGDVFDHYCGDALIAAGYETDRSWLDQLVEKPILESAA